MHLSFVPIIVQLKWYYLKHSVAFYSFILMYRPVGVGEVAVHQREANCNISERKGVKKLGGDKETCDRLFGVDGK